MKKWLSIIIVFVLIAGGAATWYLTKGNAKEVTAITQTTTVKKGTLESKVSGSGSLSPAVDEDIKAEADHTVYDIYVSEGDKVKKGDDILIYNNGVKLEAPASGAITSIGVYDNSRVQAGTVVAHLTSYNNLNTVIQADELDVPDVKKEQSVEITVNAYPDQKYKGKVKKIAKEGEVTNGVSSFDVTIHLNSSKKLKAGMTTTAEIITKQKKNVFYVPVEAVHKSGDQSYVLVTEDQSGNGPNDQSQNRQEQQNSTTQRVEVKTGMHNDSNVEITSGLTEGQIVQLPQIRVNQNQNQNDGQMGPRMFPGGGFDGFSGRSGENRGGRPDSGGFSRGGQ